MTRKYTVTQRNGAGKTITSTQYKDAEEALGNFISLLRTVGHGGSKVEHFLKVWTCTLMSGAQGYEVLDPGLQGSVSINITTT